MYLDLDLVVTRPQDPGKLRRHLLDISAAKPPCVTVEDERKFHSDICCEAV
jgi:hypothetical protein